MAGPLEVRVHDFNIEQALKELKKRMVSEGVMKEIKRRRYYEKPSARKRRKKQEEERRRIKRLRRMLMKQRGRQNRR